MEIVKDLVALINGAQFTHHLDQAWIHHMFLSGQIVSWCAQMQAKNQDLRIEFQQQCQVPTFADISQFQVPPMPFSAKVQLYFFMRKALLAMKQFYLYPQRINKNSLKLYGLA